MSLKPSPGIKNKYILVTGANSGTGFEIAKSFLLKGAVVGAHHHNDEVGAKKLFQYARPKQCQVFRADFSDPEEVTRLWQKFISWSRGKIDILVNNAATLGKGSDDWDAVFQVNVKAPFLLSRSAFKVMSQQKSGRIINISSMAVKIGGSLADIHYSASKAALEAVTKSFAKAGAKYNVLVNAVRPGITDSPLHKKLAKNDSSFTINSIPLKRFALPEEIANAVIFLAGSESSFITNTVVEVAGGT